MAFLMDKYISDYYYSMLTLKLLLLFALFEGFDLIVSVRAAQLFVRVLITV